MEPDTLLYMGLIALIGFIIGVLGVRLSMPILRRFRIVDVPNKRRFHSKVKPRGAGMFLIPIILIGWLCFGFYFDVESFVLLSIAAAIFLVFGISALDDIKPLAPRTRFIVQIIACVIGIYALDNHMLVFQNYVPFWLDRGLAFIALLWFTNLYNFMDGVDGITGVETATISLGLASIMVINHIGGSVFIPSVNMLIFGLILGFLVWNWMPSKILIGDSGSVPLGFLMGWMLLSLAGTGYFWAAAILPLYHCADATTTIVMRLMRREKIWEPHRLHFFHRPVSHTYSHAQVVRRILTLNIILFGCAHWTAYSADFLWQLPAITLALGATITLMLHFFGKREKPTTSTTSN